MAATRPFTSPRSRESFEASSKAQPGHSPSTGTSGGRTMAPQSQITARSSSGEIVEEERTAGEWTVEIRQSGVIVRLAAYV